MISVLACNAVTAQAAPFMIVGDDEKVGIAALKNSVVGPPVNLAIDPTNSVAIVADSMDAVHDGDNWKQIPDNKREQLYASNPCTRYLLCDLDARDLGLHLLQQERKIKRRPDVKNPVSIQRSMLRKQRLLSRYQYVPATVGSNQTATQ
jgi:hypothetical protein